MQSAIETSIDQLKIFSEIESIPEIITKLRDSLDQDLDLIRRQLQKIIDKEQNPSIRKEDIWLFDDCYLTLLVLAKYQPLNKEDPITCCEIDENDRVVVSSGHQFSLQSIMENFYYSKEYVNPFTRNPFLKADIFYINEEFGKRRAIQLITGYLQPFADCEEILEILASLNSVLIIFGVVQDEKINFVRQQLEKILNKDENTQIHKGHLSLSDVSHSALILLAKWRAIDDRDLFSDNLIVNSFAKVVISTGHQFSCLSLTRDTLDKILSGEILNPLTNNPFSQRDHHYIKNELRKCHIIAAVTKNLSTFSDFQEISEILDFGIRYLQNSLFNPDFAISGYVESLRKKFQDILKNDHANFVINNVCLADIVHQVLILFAKWHPLNERDPFSDKQILADDRVVTSSGHQFTLLELSQSFETSGQAINPITELPFSERDYIYIISQSNNWNLVETINHLKPFSDNEAICMALAELEEEKYYMDVKWIREIYMGSVRQRLKAILNNEKNISIIKEGVSLADAAYQALICLAKFNPSNQVDPLTGNLIDPMDCVVTSTGHQFSLSALIQYLASGKSRNPITNLVFSSRDYDYIFAQYNSNKFPDLIQIENLQTADRSEYRQIQLWVLRSLKFFATVVSLWIVCFGLDISFDLMTLILIALIGQLVPALQNFLSFGEQRGQQPRQFYSFFHPQRSNHEGILSRLARQFIMWDAAQLSNIEDLNRLTIARDHAVAQIERNSENNTNQRRFG